LNKFTKLALNNKNAVDKLSKFKLEPDIDKLGKINQVLTKNQQLLVQVVKEPISTKGPRLSCELSIAGRYIILVPFSNTVNISKKITDSAERKRLRSEEHTSELQSRENLVCRLLLEKKNK